MLTSFLFYFTFTEVFRLIIHPAAISSLYLSIPITTLCSQS